MHEYPVNGEDKSVRNGEPETLKHSLQRFLNSLHAGREDVVFYFGAERHHSRNFPLEKCRRSGVFRQGEDLHSKGSERLA